jgi:tetratricopeptide (TPR) repeat protein
LSENVSRGGAGGSSDGGSAEERPAVRGGESPGHSGRDAVTISSKPEAGGGPPATAGILLASVLVLHALAYFLLPGWLWGADTLKSLVGASAVGALVLASLALVPRIASVALLPLEAVARRRFVSLFADKVLALTLAAVLALVVFWRLGVLDAGTRAWLFHYPYYLRQTVAPEAGLSLPVPLDSLTDGLSKLLDVSYPKADRGLVVGLGAVFVCSLLLLPFASRSTGRRAAPGLLLALSGVCLVFLGSRADLALAVTATAVFIALGWRAAEAGTSPLWAGLAALCAALAHPIGLALLPAWAFLVWRLDEAPKASRFWVPLVSSFALFVAVQGLFDLAGRPASASLLTEIRDLWAAWSGTHAGWVLGGIGGGGALEMISKVGGWLVERAWGTANGLLLVAPVGLALGLAAVVGGGYGGRGRAFIGFTALATAAASFAASPYPGPPRMWGLYAPAGVCVTAFGALWLAETVRDGRKYRAALLGCVVLSVVHLVPALLVPSDRHLGAEMLSREASARSPWDVRGRAQALEELSTFNLALGDTLAAAGDLSKAWEAVPNPLYLGTAGAYYAGARRYDLAEDEFTLLVEQRPFDVEANLSLGILHAVRADMEGAKHFFMVAYGDTALSLQTPEVDTREDWEDMPKGPERERLLRGRIARRNEATEVFIRGDEAAKRGLLKAAEQLYRRALEIYPRWGRMQYESHSHLGTIYAMQGRYREAAYELLLATAAFKNYALCYYIVNGIGYGPARPQVAAQHLMPPSE